MTRKKYTTAMLIITLAFAFAICGSTEAKIRMSKKNIRITVPQKCTLRLKGAKGKVIWKSSKPSVAKVNQNGKVTALRTGKATITAKAGKKKFTCIVVVKESKEKLKIAPDKPTPVPSEPARTDEPTAVPYNPMPTPELSTKRPGEPTAVPDKPTPTPTPGDSEWCAPCVQDYDVYRDCHVSDIGEDFMEISDENGAVIYKFDKFYPDLDVDELDKLKVVYDGKVVMYGTETSLKSYEIEGENVVFADIRIGDTVDVVYGFYLDVPIERRTFECMGINIHKR